MMAKLADVRRKIQMKKESVGNTMKLGQQQLERLKKQQDRRELQTVDDIFDRVRRQAEEHHTHVEQETHGHSSSSNSHGSGALAAQQTNRASSSNQETDAAVQAFNDLKYGDRLGAGRAQDEFKSMFPKPPASDVEVDKQQRALLDQQQRELERLRQGVADGHSSLNREFSQSAISRQSFNIDDVARRNQQRLQDLQRRQMQDTTDKDATPDELIQRFLKRDGGDGTGTHQSAQNSNNSNSNSNNTNRPALPRSISNLLPSESDDVSLVADTTFQPSH